MLVRPDHGAVDDHPLQVRVLEGLEDPYPHPFFGPAIKPLPDRSPRPQPLGQVAPGSAGLADPEDGVDKETVVFGGDAGVAGLAREYIFDAFPVLVLDLVAAHRSTPVAKLRGEPCPSCSKPPRFVYTA